MLCELGLCVLLQGGLGIQDGYYLEGNTYQVQDDHQITNDYGMLTGEISLRAKYKNLVIEPFYHLSGINTAETDLGMNAAFIGYEVNNGGWFLRTSVGTQLQFDGYESNTYGSVLYKVQAGFVANNGLYAQYGRIDDMQQVTAGFTARLW